MKRLEELLAPERVASRTYASSKKRSLEMISELLVQGDTGLTQAEVFTSLVERERLGSTGLGGGVAIPHGRGKKLNQAVCAFLKLNQGVDYDAVDGRPVDLICALLVPEASTHEHLDILAVLAEMFSDGELVRKVRAAATGREVYDLLISWRPIDMPRAADPTA